MTAQKRVIKHQCYCRDCDEYWESTDSFSNCPICGKKIIAKMCIMRVEEIKEEGEDE